MSNLATGLVWERFDGGGTDLLVMLAIADSLNAETGRCDPSYKHLADKTRTSRATVIRAVERLSEAGHIRVIKRTRDDKSQRSNEFHLAPGYTDASAREWLHPATTGLQSDTIPQSQTDTPPVSERHPPQGHGDTPPVSLVIPQEPEVNQEDEPGKEPTEGEEPRGQKPATRKRRTPALGPGCLALRDVTERTPPRVWRDDVEAAYERHGDARFREVAKSWMGRHFNPGNVSGILDVMENGWSKRTGRTGPPPADDGTNPDDWGWGTQPIPADPPQQEAAL